ncbi:MAG: MoaD/ThiS family protein [Halanaerobiales bacterium]|nr:MoaD/ThiS family protein [Halanaerobiales bacterium]
MILVRFFGTLRLSIGESRLEMEAERIDQLLVKINQKYNKIGIKQLKNAVIFINNQNINKLERFKSRLKDGDEVLFISAMGGG